MLGLRIDWRSWKMSIGSIFNSGEMGPLGSVLFGPILVNLYNEFKMGPKRTDPNGPASCERGEKTWK